MAYTSDYKVHQQASAMSPYFDSLRVEAAPIKHNKITVIALVVTTMSHHRESGRQRAGWICPTLQQVLPPFKIGPSFTYEFEVQSDDVRAGPTRYVITSREQLILVIQESDVNTE